MPKEPYKLAFVTVNYNGIADTKDFLASVERAQLSMEYVVVVIDNGSKQNEWEILKAEFPTIVGLRSADNLGFAGGNNLALPLVDAEYFYFINNDTLLPIDADQQLKDMLSFLDNNPTVGGLSPKLMYVDDPNLIQFAGCTDLSPITIRNRQIGYQEVDQGQYQEITSVPYLHGAAMLIPNHVIKEIGPMPELYFLYYEELDWCYSITQKYHLYYYPNAYIRHKESASTGMNSPFKTYYLSRNRLIYAFRNRQGFTRIASIIYLIFVTFIHSLLLMVKGLWRNSKAMCKGMIDATCWMFAQRNV